MFAFRLQMFEAEFKYEYILTVHKYIEVFYTII